MLRPNARDDSWYWNSKKTEGRYDVLPSLSHPPFPEAGKKFQFFDTLRNQLYLAIPVNILFINILRYLYYI